MADILTEAVRLGLRWGRADGVLVTRAAVVAEARSWINTPFHHQAEIKGIGVDCGGLMRGVSIALGLIPANYRDLVPPSLHGYSREPHGDLGRELCDLYLHRIDPATVRPGDVVVVQWNGPPRHMAIVASDGNGPTMIHAENERWKKVVEHTLRVLSRTSPKSPKIAYAYSIPGVEP